MIDKSESLKRRRENQDRLFPRRLMRVYEDMHSPTNQWHDVPVALPQICLDVRMALNGSADPWPEDEMRKVGEFLSLTLEGWDDRSGRQDEMDSGVLLMVHAALAMIRSSFPEPTPPPTGDLGRLVVCPICEGTGQVHSHNPTCPTCGGRGATTAGRAREAEEQERRIAAAFRPHTWDYQ